MKEARDARREGGVRKETTCSRHYRVHAVHGNEREEERERGGNAGEAGEITPPAETKIIWEEKGEVGKEAY